MNQLSRRKFMKVTTALLATAILPDCENPNRRVQVLNNLETALKKNAEIAKEGGWDPVYGPILVADKHYHGDQNFDAHIAAGKKGGVDYDVPLGTLLTPSHAGYLNSISHGSGGYMISILDQNNSRYRTHYGHISDALVGEKSVNYSRKGPIPVDRNQLIALSGTTYNPRVEHLHLSLLTLEDNIYGLELIDPEKHGLDGEKPVFWDGDTNLDVDTFERPWLLEETLQTAPAQVEKWKQYAKENNDSNLYELSGKVQEHLKRIETSKGNSPLDSKHFHDMRALLKKVTLGEGRETPLEKRPYVPGTGPYSLMQKIVAYSMVNQKIIITLPFISPDINK
jgi:hypothetical protein